MKIQDVMTKSVHCVKESTTVKEIACLMRDEKIGDVLVVDDAGKLCGIVTDRDIVVRACAEGKDLSKMTAKDVESEKLVTLEASASSEEAVRIMRDRAIRRIPVVEDDKPVGIVTIGDLAQQHDPRSALGQISKAAPNN